MIRTIVISRNILHVGWNPLIRTKVELSVLLVSQGLPCLYLSVEFPLGVCFTNLKGLNSAEFGDEVGRYRKSQGQERRCWNGTQELGPSRR